LRVEGQEKRHNPAAAGEGGIWYEERQTSWKKGNNTENRHKNTTRQESGSWVKKDEEGGVIEEWGNLWYRVERANALGEKQKKEGDSARGVRKRSGRVKGPPSNIKAPRELKNDRSEKGSMKQF